MSVRQIGQININSILSKFNLLKELVLKHVDILVVCEIKLDETFPSSQFHMAGFSLPYRLDRNRNSGGVMIFVKEDFFFFFFFNCYLAVPRPTLGHSWGDSLANPMLITAFFYIFDPKVTRSLVTRLGP